MADYPDIADHGLIGDLQTAALVTTDGTIDWFCCPRFDSPSVFASLLDHEKGGRFTLHPVDTDCVSKQMYLPDTAVLVTRFLSPKGVVEVTDLPRRLHAARYVQLTKPVRARGRGPFVLSDMSNSQNDACARERTGDHPDRLRQGTGDHPGGSMSPGYAARRRLVQDVRGVVQRLVRGVQSVAMPGLEQHDYLCA
jgi:Trehalase-like, N-terminal